jgi:hypothetical protein
MMKCRTGGPGSTAWLVQIPHMMYTRYVTVIADEIAYFTYLEI